MEDRTPCSVKKGNTVVATECEHFKKALSQFPTGVAIVTLYDAQTQKKYGITVNAFSAVSLHPPMVLWILARTSKLHDLLVQKKLSYRIHILSEHQLDLVQQFAKGEHELRFQGVHHHVNERGFVALDTDHTVSWFECDYGAQYDGGDHSIFVGKVQYCFYQDQDPVLYHKGQLHPISSPK